MLRFGVFLRAFGGAAGHRVGSPGAPTVGQPGYQPKLGASPVQPARKTMEMPTEDLTPRGGMYFPREQGDARCDVCKTFRPSMALEHDRGGYQCIEAQVDP